MTTAALTKPVDELIAQDIRGLVTNQIQEGEHVEFKEGFSSSRNARQATGQIRTTNDDKTKILKEIVAFANGYGGRLFIGIEEDGGNPPVAASVTPLADCTNLADRFGRACAELIDPPMLRLDVLGIPTEQDGSGVIVFDVPRSIRSPHMSKRDNRAYRRRGTESIPMDMRDIQDMTLRSASRFTEIEAEFAKRQQSFDQNVTAYKSANDQGYCFRLSLVPLDDVDLGDVRRNQAVLSLPNHLSAHFKSNSNGSFAILPPSNAYANRATVRGTKLYRTVSTNRESVPKWEFTLWSNGGMEVWYADNPRHQERLVLPLLRVVFWFAHALRNVERVRIHSGLSALSYGAEAQMEVFGETAVFLGFSEPRFMQDLADLKCGHHLFPRYEVGPKDSFNETVNLFVKDCFNDAGLDWDDEIVVSYGLD